MVGGFQIIEDEFARSSVNELKTLVQKYSRAHFRLAWIAGRNPRHRSTVLNLFAEDDGFALVDVGKELAAKLLDETPSVRAHAAEDCFYDIIAARDAERLCLDHLDILFDECLKLNAVDLVRNASRKFLLVASWPGAVIDDALVYGVDEHPSHIRIPSESLECPVHILSVS